MRRITILLSLLLLASPLVSQASTAIVYFATGVLPPVTDKMTETPFSDITVSNTDAVTFQPVTISYPTNHGWLTLSAPQYDLVYTNGEYQMSRSGMNATEAMTGLGNIVFHPFQNRIPRGTVETNAFLVTVTDENGSSSNATVSLPVTPANDPPSVWLSSTVAGIDDTGTSLPFASMTIDDVDSNDAVTVQVRFRSVQGTLATNADFVRTTLGGSAVYTLTSQDADSAETFMRAVVFTPSENRIPVGTTESTIFTARVSDLDGAAATDTVSLVVTPVNDAPLFSGSIVTPVNDSAATNLFPGFVVTDVDNTGTQRVVATASISGGGYEYGGGEFSYGGDLTPVVSFTNTPAGVSTSLQGLQFLPYTNLMAVGSVATVSVTLVVHDVVAAAPGEELASPSNQTYTVVVRSVNDPPWITPALAASITDSANSRPFSATLGDPDTQDDEALTLRVALTNAADAAVGRLSPTNQYSGSASGIASWLQNTLTFIPVPNSVATNRVLVFRFTVWDTHGATNSVLASLLITGRNDKPVIRGTPTADLRMTDDPTTPIYPFTGVSIEDYDGGQTLTVTLSMSDTNMGYYSTTTLTGTPAQITEAIRTVSFTAIRRMDRRIGDTLPVTLTIQAADNEGASEVNSDTRILITSVNGSPRIVGIPPVQPVLIPPAPPILPFRGLSVVDDDTNAVKVWVSLDNPDKGVLTNLGGFVATVPGTYLINTNQEAASQALSNLAFVASETFAFPVNAPGATTFTLTIQDYVLNQASKTLSIVLQYEPRNILVTRATDDTLPGSLRYAVAHCENNGFITFALEEYPAVIQLDSSQGPIELARNVNFRGPGADRLAISGDSNGDGIPDVQLFQIRSVVTMEGMTLTKGASSYSGGAVYVGAGGSLSLAYCAVTECQALQWGGAIDVEAGALSLTGCLIRSNAVSQASGRGGGGISLWTGQACSFVNSTFSGNRQRCASGATAVGGGAVYAEKHETSSALDLVVRHCSFAENEDAVEMGSAILSVGFGTVVTAGNSIFMDTSARNLGVYAGDILSEGGNLAVDSTRAVLTQGGAPEEVILLNHVSDLTEVPAGTVLEPVLATGLRPTTGYRLVAGSPAIGHATTPLAAVDQLGVLRDGLPDSGALEYSRTARIVLNEIQFDPATGEPEWLEFYVPRDSSPVEFGGLTVRINGVTNHVFAPLTCQPGHGVILADTNGTMVLSPTNNPIPVLHPSLTNLDLKSAGTIALVNPAQGWMEALCVNYLGVFADPATPTQTLAAVHNSITLAPQFAGAAYVPHSVVLSPPQGGVDMSRSTAVNTSSPGSDTSPAAFGSRNAMPQAQADGLVVNEDDLTLLPVLANDSDADGLDQLAIAGIAPVAPADQAVTNSVQGAVISLDPATVLDAAATPPLRGTSVIYDPRLTAGIQALPAGAKITDSFCYDMVDIGAGAISAYAATGMVTEVQSAGHRLTNGEEIVISGCTVTNYNEIWAVTVVNDNAFTIPVAFAGSAVGNGSWVTRNQRQETALAHGTVTLEVLGANDFPIPVPDTVPAEEETVLRLMGDSTLAGATGLVFETDAAYAMRPVISSASILTNDWDPDLDDNAGTLSLVGVISQVHAITNYEGATGLAPVLVKSPAHGLSEGATILLSGYAGHPSYRGYHAVSVVDADSFTIPVRYVDNAAAKGEWAILTDTGRLAATSALGVPVSLDLRAQRAETSILYDPTRSAALNQLAEGETGTDTFYCAVADRHGAVSIGEIQMLVAGRNDTPLAQPDPDPLSSLASGLTCAELQDRLAQVGVDYALPPASGKASRADARLQSGSGETALTAVLPDLWVTDEDTPLVIQSADMLANDTDVDASDTLVVQALSASSFEGAGLLLESNGVTLVYDPVPAASLNALARNEFKIDSFTAVVGDQHGGLSTSVVAVLVVGRDDSPLALDDTATAVENQVLVVGPASGVLVNDLEYDINGAVPDNTRSLLERPGFLTQLPDVWARITNNTVVYDPTASRFLEGLAAGQTLADQVPYVMMDGSFVFANADRFSVQAGASNIVLDVLANDRNYTGNGGNLRIIAAGNPSEGGQCVTGAAGSNLVYTPPPAFVGDEVVTYTIDDGRGNSDRAQVVIRVTVNRLNGLLQAGDDAFAVARGETVSLDVLLNDDVLPESGAALELAGVVSVPSAGGQAVVEDGAITYAPDPLHAGAYPYSESFVYAVSGGGSSMATATVTVLVINRQGMLEVKDDAFSVNAGSLGAPLDVLLNDDILPGLPVVLTVRQAGPAAHGTVLIDGDERGVTYVPPADFTGMDSFGYVATDGIGGTGTGVVTVTVGTLTSCDDALVVTNLATTVDLDVLANDRILQAAYGANVLIAAVTPTNTAVGPIAVRPDGRRLRLGPISQAGQQTLAYSITDGSRVAEATLRLLVMTNGIEAAADVFAVLPDSMANTLDVLHNDVTLPGQGKTLAVLSVGTGQDAPDHGGTVTIASDSRSLLYTPAPGFAGEETFTYTMTDSTRTDTAKVVVKVVRGDIQANTDTFTVFMEPPPEGGEPQSFVLPVVFNDMILPDRGQTLSVAALGNGTNAPDHQGSVVIAEGAQSLTYVPFLTNAVVDYVERFTYEVSDGSERRAQGSVYVRVVNRTNAVDAATCDDAFAVERNSTNNILDVLANDQVKPGLATGWNVVGVSTSLAGGGTALSGNRIRYTPPAGFVGTDHFTYRVNDGFGGTGAGLVSVRVGGLTVNPDFFTAISSSESNRLAVLVNDPVLPATTANYQLAEAWGATAGGAAGVSGGQVTYSPQAGYAGPWPYQEAFSYRVVDDTGNCSTGSVAVLIYRDGADRSNAVLRVTVAGSNDAPVITGTVAGQRYFMQDLQPFAGVTVSDVDNFGGELQTVTVTLADPSHGGWVSTGAFTAVSNGVIRLAGVTPLQASLALRGLVFHPAINPAGAGLGRVTRLSIAVSDGVVTVTDTNTTLVDTPLVETRISPESEVSGALFGSSVAASSNLVVAGTANEVSNGISYVSASLLNAPADPQGIWSLDGKILSRDFQTGGLCGVSVALDGDLLLVGAPRAVTNTVRTGVAYLYSRHQGGSNAWGLVKRFLAYDAAAEDEYGSLVAVSGDTLAVAADRDTTSAAQGGSVYLYARHQGGTNQWGLVKKIVPADTAADDAFGGGLALEGDILAVGAPNRDDRGANSGAVYLYSRNQGGTNQWGLVLKQYADDVALSRQFGFAVSLRGSFMAVGAPYDVQYGTNAGAVYVFNRNQGGSNLWGQVRKLTPTEVTVNKEYGWSVSLDADWLAVGAKSGSTNGIKTGSAYLYAGSSGAYEPWSLVRKFTPSSGAAADEYGCAIAVRDNVLAVGARSANIPVARRGAVHVYRLEFNNAPEVANPIPAQLAEAGKMFGLIVPPDTFADPDPGDILTLLPDYSGTPGLGTWLGFDSISQSFSGVPPMAGTNTVRLIARDLQGAKATNTFLLVVVPDAALMGGATPFQLWKDLYFGATMLADGSQEAALWGNAADPDGDGVPNLTEYLFGLNPRVEEPAGAASLELGPLSGSSQWASITFRRLTGDWYLTYSLESSTDLMTWQPVGALLLGETVVPLAPGLEQVTQEVLLPQPVTGPRFYRVKVTML